MLNVKHEGLKRVESKPFTYVPAAITYPSDGGLGIYVKYGSYPNRIIVKEQGHNYIWVQCPDRELLMVSNGIFHSAFRPMDGTFDEYIHLGPYHDHLNSDMNLPYFMVNYVAEASKKPSNIRANTGSNVDPNTLVMSDSGGFQIIQGRVEYLDPAKIVEWYNDNVDLGFVLDIPAAHLDRITLGRAAKVQASNTETMLAKKKDGLELINIIQGSTKSEMQFYRDIVERPEIDRLSIAGMYHFYNLMESVDLMHTIATTGQSYKHVHFLGVSNSLHTALLIRMATKGLMPHLTSDSSTPIQKARLREWHSYSSTQEKVKFMLVGYKDGYRPSPHNLLPCSCQVCSTIKYADVLWCLNGNTAHKIFEFHNIYSMSRYFDALTQYSSEMSTAEFKQLLKHQVGENRQGFAEAMHALDFMDAIAKGQGEVARERYSLYLGDTGLFSGGYDSLHSDKPNSLFSGHTDLEDTDAEGEGIEISVDAIEEVIKRYEDKELQTGLKHGKKLKTEKANTRKLKNSSGGANIKPVKASSLKKKSETKSA